MKSVSKYIAVIGFAAIAGTSCEKQFGNINTDPTIVTTPDIKYLLSYSQERLMTYNGGEWIWEGMEQLFRFTQHVTASPYEVTGNVNGRYGVYYSQILPNLFEIRRQISTLPDKDQYQKMQEVTYIIQALHGIKVTDMNGSIPYTGAIKGRYEADYSPAYDTQESLFTTWLGELDNAISILSNSSLSNQLAYGNSDIFYQGDWTKWVKLANTLKLRIAARLDNQNAAKAQEIFKQVMQNAIGPIDNDDAQLKYTNPNFSPFGNDINYRSARYGSTSIVNFLKAADDPRLPIYFESNDLTGSYEDTLAKYSTSLPAFIDPNDPHISFQGAPADWTTNPTVAGYISNAFAVGNTDPGNVVSRYFLISPINRKFFSPRLNGATGDYTDVLVSNAESCLLVAEFIEKGYGNGIDTKGTAEDWYKKGVTSSIKTMNAIAVTAQSATGFSGNGDAEIAAYLNGPEVAFNGTNDLERIYIQQYLNFYRNASEAFVLVRRTGYPRNGSAYYAREPFNEQIPRRWWLTDPGEVNRNNWNAAMSEQGFTPNAQDVPTLSSQRIWYDKNAPDFGEGQ
ncbi:SusD/RagB family nutrient-binding outer membrane lipoprotein [Agriterribacter sp.]|uniref:SusD/RagB family nutrient-binding outer membrane lipoprotein n=1 Tax=Agriterribacter sp. TaxID=2821509 RepID=UPI002C83D700|nr:SusD/RagB family nutrient-binding outer membrane lipoprotein [Agriterribacter sp.]HRO45391.1 SusD/RagB family nutrient-binding outer membrane lipoprotein [Agriterribacter sp.]HRQ16917.1 SusD/RagB family nutrient-binding outer membrane lipoprotein [Agriterribacter sp.]